MTKYVLKARLSKLNQGASVLCKLDRQHVQGELDWSTSEGKTLTFDQNDLIAINKDNRFRIELEAVLVVTKSSVGPSKERKQDGSKNEAARC
ncbi:hypothetical protein CROQUDRAFT_651499 [Cronartium quercuum f. sp. fusiforme G11]|uniref:Uncharacterized protein n=1 Tax=Cronartium quercuum f. sp. fusiforme G11 TaxID=708437 RepID=A0A9P6TG12_9BASI|nr:hypothetical protein CROQUDRAFT_651499 [Cronartium quercuum f. sp. fusiforme G11]